MEDRPELDGMAPKPKERWLERRQPWWVVVLIFCAFALVGGGFLHMGPSPVGLVVCPKARWEIRDTFDTRYCFARLFESFADSELKNQLDDARDGIRKAREDLERVRNNQFR